MSKQSARPHSMELQIPKSTRKPSAKLHLDRTNMALSETDTDATVTPERSKIKNVDPNRSHLQIMAAHKFDDNVLFKIGVNASQYVVGERQIDAEETKSDPALVFSSTTNRNLTTMTSLEIIANRYRAKAASLEPQYSVADIVKPVIISLSYNNEADKLAISMSDGRTRIASLPTWTDSAHGGSVKEMVLADEEVVFPKTAPVTATEWFPKRQGQGFEHANQVVSGYAKGLIKYWDVKTGKCLHTIETAKTAVSSICFNPFESKFAASANNKIYIYDEKLGTASGTLCSSPDAKKMDGHTSKIFQVLYHPFQRHMLLSGGWDNTILLWDERAPHATGRISGPHICGRSMDIDNNNHLLVGSWKRESNIQIFDLANNELLKEIDQYNDFRRKGTPYTKPYATRFLGNNHIVVCGSHEPMFKIYDKRDFKISGCFVDANYSMFCMSLPKRIDYPIAVGSGNNVFFMDWFALSNGAV